MKKSAIYSHYNRDCLSVAELRRAVRDGRKRTVCGKRIYSFKFSGNKKEAHELLKGLSPIEEKFRFNLKVLDGYRKRGAYCEEELYRRYLSHRLEYCVFMNNFLKENQKKYNYCFSAERVYA